MAPKGEGCLVVVVASPERAICHDCVRSGLQDAADTIPLNYSADFSKARATRKPRSSISRHASLAGSRAGLVSAGRIVPPGMFLDASLRGAAVLGDSEHYQGRIIHHPLQTRRT
ncbi:MAG: hypothetical protein ABIF77_10975 [bacterium]